MGFHISSSLRHFKRDLFYFLTFYIQNLELVFKKIYEIHRDTSSKCSRYTIKITGEKKSNLN
jgi:hypothetical protein